MMTLAEIVERAIRAAGIPCAGVVIGNDADRATWRVVFAEGVTPAQRTQAASILASVDVTPATLADADLQARLSGDKLFRATVIWMAQKVGVTPQQARTEIVAIYKQL